MTTVQILIIVLGVIGTFISGLGVWFIKSLITTVYKTELELHLLNANIKSIIEETKSIPKIKEDLNELHRRVKKDKHNGQD